MKKLAISPVAKSDLKEIKRYITEELDNPHAAKNVISKILQRIKTLQDFPEIGSPLSSIIEIETPYRFLVCGNYLAFYRVEKNTVFVDRVLYGRRDYIKILFPDIDDKEI
jgi:addiction module RelE/StbE family toxin